MKITNEEIRVLFSTDTAKVFLTCYVVSNTTPLPLKVLHIHRQVAGFNDYHVNSNLRDDSVKCRDDLIRGSLYRHV
jgi:hypothetical protein